MLKEIREERKSFIERVRLYKQKVTPHRELYELIERMDDEKARLVLAFAKSMDKGV